MQNYDIFVYVLLVNNDLKLTIISLPECTDLEGGVKWSLVEVIINLKISLTGKRFLN